MEKGRVCKTCKNNVADNQWCYGLTSKSCNRWEAKPSQPSGIEELLRPLLLACHKDDSSGNLQTYYPIGKIAEAINSYLRDKIDGQSVLVRDGKKIHAHSYVMGYRKALADFKQALGL